MTTQQPWTFESLAQAGRATFEQILCHNPPPDPAQLAGYVYKGWNDGFITYLTGRKFKKCFWQDGDGGQGCNLVIMYDFKEYRGEWREVSLFGQTLRAGYYGIQEVPQASSIAEYVPYQPLKLLNYNVGRNTWLNLPLRTIRDVVALPNPDTHELVLGKAYIQLLPLSLVFVSYFVLGMREPLSADFVR
ncbi:MAG: hypothetical protein KJ065_02420 [Anaerolineae bacterium]|nr:hypothetical protein [Anaerolineae bacterium]